MPASDTITYRLATVDDVDTLAAPEVGDGDRAPP